VYISKIHIKGFRNFKDTIVEFNDGVNVIIGPNNSGKSNMICALALLLEQNKSKKLNLDDFCKDITLDEIKAVPPRITIELTFHQSKNEDLNSDDLVTISNWLIKLEEPYEALLTYEYFLPENECQKYLASMSNVINLSEARRVLKDDFIRLYTYRLYGGYSNLRNTADGETMQKFDFQFLDALRDVERDMYTGKNTMLRDILDFFLDYEIKIDSTKDKEAKQNEIKEKRVSFSAKAEVLLNELTQRMSSGKDQILSYAEETGASFNNAKPDFDGSISEIELFSMLKLIVEYGTEIKIPITHNGLGYNNLIYMSLLLAKMQVITDGTYYGCNAKVFPVLAIEEPEAHLHPAMQYKFLKFLKNNIEKKKKVRQIFVTTHSTQITAAVSLDEIICIHDNQGYSSVGYPGKVFHDYEVDKRSKSYVQRFLDSTRSDMLFAQKVILVEGISELLLLPTFALCLGYSLEDNHVAVINIGGRYFDHFLKLFDSNNAKAINKKIACITDRDPVRRQNGGSYEKCYPFEYNQDPDSFEYKNNSHDNVQGYLEHPNIRYFAQDSDKYKTLEYDLAYLNSSCNLLLTESLSNYTELSRIMRNIQENRSIEECFALINNSDKSNRIKESLSSCDWDEIDKKKALFASRYLNSVGKGENAIELANVLVNNYQSTSPIQINIPNYIRNAIEWICQ
jgi:predicted ATP-dependent endonuclease of OLD family